MPLEDYEMSYILVLFLFHNIHLNSLKVDHLYDSKKKKKVTIKLENVINQNIPFSVKQVISIHYGHVYLG